MDWTLEQDEELRAACERAGGDLSLKKTKWWEELARGFPGANAKGLQQVGCEPATAAALRSAAPHCAPAPPMPPRTRAPRDVAPQWGWLARTVAVRLTVRRALRSAGCTSATYRASSTRRLPAATATHAPRRGAKSRRPTRKGGMCTLQHLLPLFFPFLSRPLPVPRPEPVPDIRTGSVAGSLATKAGYGGQRTAAARSDRTNNPVGVPSNGSAGAGSGQAGGAAARRPFSASSVRISATRQSAVGQVPASRCSYLASPYTLATHACGHVSGAGLCADRSAPPTASLLPLFPARLLLLLLLLLLVPWRQLRGAALASSHTPLLAFSKGNADRNKTDKGAAGPVSSPGGGSLTSPTRDKYDSEGAGRGGKGKGNETTKSSSPVTGGGDKEGGGGAKKGKSGDENLIVIHVCDENRGINRDFTCRKDVLLSEMAYFRS